MQGIKGFWRYCLECRQARPQNFVEVVMLFVRANVECKLIRWPITIERALIRVSMCRSTNGRLMPTPVPGYSYGVAIHARRRGGSEKKSSRLASLDQALDIP